MLVLFCLAASGCGTVGETITLSKWREVGSRAAPEPEGKELVVTRLTAGSGASVAAGDLVKVRVSSMDCVGPDHRTKLDPDTLWLWAGREPSREGKEVLRWGDLGSPDFRGVLVGKRVGDHLRIEGTQGDHRIHKIPLNGFTVYRESALRSFYEYVPESTREFPWPDHAVVARGLSSQLEILATCRATLQRRDAVIHQVGKIFEMFDSPRYDVHRRDTIGWSALEAECPGEKVRLQAGPLYYRETGNPKKLHGWESSLLKLRPPAEFPEDYVARALPPRHCFARPQ